MATSKKRAKQKATKAARKAALRAQYALMNEQQRKELNPRVPYQRRKIDRNAGRPMASRPVPPWFSAIAPKGA